MSLMGLGGLGMSGLGDICFSCNSRTCHHMMQQFGAQQQMSQSDLARYYRDHIMIASGSISLPVEGITSIGSTKPSSEDRIVLAHTQKNKPNKLLLLL